MNAFGPAQLLFLTGSIGAPQLPAPQILYFDVYYVDAPIVGVQVTGDPNAD